ncbi:MAG: hypothetical protein QOJ79_818 [Actinomycetota bacterium]|jgi:hypothetical protein|nr:hypothetical protein [Actinomycetota bacterium]
MQIVFLSARPDVLAGTLRHVRAKLPFLDRFLVVTPERLRAPMTGLGIEVVTDEELLGGPGPGDHSQRNYALRAAMSDCTSIDDVFLSSDDDSRPLVPLDETVFVRAGRYRRYTFGHLDDWELRTTSYDACLLASRAVLALHALPRVAYASHQPQIIDKALLREVTALFAAAAARHPLDEWAMYFNAAGALHPDRFEQPEPYLTLGWPENAAAWHPLLDPGALLIENTFLEHYAAGGVFDGLDPDDTSYDAAADKVVRWRTYELEVAAGERHAALVPKAPAGPLGEAARRARAATVGAPSHRARERRAAVSALLRALARRP